MTHFTTQSGNKHGTKCLDEFVLGTTIILSGNREWKLSLPVGLHDQQQRVKKAVIAGEAQDSFIFLLQPPSIPSPTF